MASVTVTVSSDLDPAAAWALASDLQRFDEWLTIFGGWKSEVPSTITEGTSVASLIKVKGFRNVIKWTVTQYDEPENIGLTGTGRGGVKIDLSMQVTPNGGGSEFDLTAQLRGGLLSGPVGKLVARVIESDVRSSVDNLAALTA